MPCFKIIKDPSEITLDNKWIVSTKFESKDRLVDYKGRQYRIIEKRERTFSTPERIGRGSLGTLAVVCTLCLALFSKSVRNLFTKPKTNVRFGILEEQAKFKVEEKQTKFKVEQGKLVYIKPELLFGGTKISGEQELNFALVKTGGKQELVAVTGDGKEYRTYEGSAFEALLKLAQDKNPIMHRHFGSPIGYFLKHPNNSIINEAEFLEFILEKDQTRTPRICTLNSDSTLEVLNIIKEKNIPINLNDKTSEGETLFTLWAGKGDPEITELMLELDSSVIEQTRGQIKSAFVEAALNASKEEADILISAMDKKNIILSPEEEWIKRAFKNDCEFSEEAFTQLDQELKIKVFFVANAFANEDIVKKLKPLGMGEAPLFWPGPHILARNMDIITARNVIDGFLKGLRKDGLLLTAEEFSKLDKNKYISKIDQIGRIQGKNFIEKLIKENGLKHIKVPRKIVVVNEGLQNISFHIVNSLELIPKRDQLTIYAECVKSVDRKISLEEAIEFMIILEKTGYKDFYGENFFLAEDGIYFIDTEYKDFSPRQPQFSFIKAITNTNLMDPKDAETFLAEYQKRKEAYDKEKELRRAQLKEYRLAFKNPYKRLATGYSNSGHEFAFQLNSLLT
ncbi:putative uncharacterized protein [Parachlamydia acanthamoebae UV-7]|uniref:Uncharacterized protein n=2 Tax=Parachlamydia acanthamoebae TaxID=83552 RepID=F8L1H3_PARAV|nr:hypothetical protein [Parachlamydia acanthamoebae]KIA77164.1 hypothetical protein DB43_GT00050 [Parachlamydia acanthamoebae]CCB87115.1 putative uncharacterized protein [Parachlamydia acanthamoebae UV-7]